jgi:hypothetical protein
MTEPQTNPIPCSKVIIVLPIGATAEMSSWDIRLLATAAPFASSSAWRVLRALPWVIHSSQRSDAATISRARALMRSFKSGGDTLLRSTATWVGQSWPRPAGNTKTPNALTLLRLRRDEAILLVGARSARPRTSEAALTVTRRASVFVPQLKQLQVGTRSGADFRSRRALSRVSSFAAARRPGSSSK